MHLLKAYYDKLLAVLALIVLLFSLVYLAVTGGNRQQIQDRYIGKLERMVVEHPELHEFDPEPIAESVEDARNPFQLATASNSVPGFFITEQRVWCVNCRHPIAVDALVCSFCSEEQPLVDGETPVAVVVEEKDPEIPMLDRLRVKKISSTPLPIRFMGRIELPDGEFMAQINVNRGRTYMVREGNPVGGTGFVLERFEIRNLMRTPPGNAQPREIPVPFVILKYGDSVVELEMGDQKIHVNHEVDLTDRADDTQVWSVAMDGKIRIQDVEFKLIEVDNESGSVVIQDESNGTKRRVPGL